ncbi:nuclear transport factor 2 family protein [Chachezhania sediminis]|uniref:nuclear transport factor 2 family protein n=1 Tax=Chachezhania sediminis TaxID=2599291 RepID=UPI00131B1B17|nr:nuclear transport factor 2 family protein [Chachezhania sediminis]
MLEETETAELEARERERCDYILAANLDALGPMLSDDLAHVHLNGVLDDKVGYLASVGTKFSVEHIERGPLQIRVYDGFAVMIGELRQTIVANDTGQRLSATAMSTQVWRKQDRRWLLNTCHNAMLAQEG